MQMIVAGNNAGKAIDLIMIAKYLERIGDHADQYRRVGGIFYYGNPQGTEECLRGESGMIYCVEDDSNIREL